MQTYLKTPLVSGCLLRLLHLIIHTFGFQANITNRLDGLENCDDFVQDFDRDIQKF